ncbi:MAG TPA: aldo/keto reductase [Polyangiaceae bacterium]|nr:aldo/keto reductase [Polyangiaceae bacterium]
MARPPHEANKPSESATSEPPEGHEQKPFASLLPTRRQFVVGVSGAVIGVACAESHEGGGVPTGTGGTSGGVSAGGAKATGGAPSTGAASSTGGAVSTAGASGGLTSTADARGGSPSTGGAASSGGAASGGVPAGGAASGGVPAGGAASGGVPAGGAASGGTSGGVTRKLASDQVVLGATGIKVSRLAMGCGSHGSNKGSDQARLGVDAFAGLLKYAYSQGINFFETADAYGSHPHVAEAIRQVGRNNVVVLTKTMSQRAADVEADLARFRTELGIDVIDIVLLHLKTSSRWATDCEGAMEVLSKAKESGAIRAHGVSCHSLQALRLAAATPWVDVDLARINPAGVVMDSDPTTVISVLREMKTANKGVIGMKILGEGQLADRLDQAIQHAVGLDCIDGFTIGFTSQAQLDQVIQKIAAV